jgi:hypothetical protein
MVLIDNTSQMVDKYSVANFQNLESVHYSLDLGIDFPNKK